jgi:hypothetical protein
MLGGTLLAALFAGCGGEDDFANEPRPPSPIVVTASIGEDAVSVSPTSFGAGPVNLIVTNQTGASQRLTLETEDVSEGAGITQGTGPINPRDTASLKADLEEGTYTVAVGSESLESATLEVGPPRESAQNELLQP